MKTLVIILTCITTTAIAQNILVEKVPFTSTIDKTSISNIPRVKDMADPQNPAIPKINQFILDRFDLTSYNQKDVEEFRWFEVKFNSEARDNILYIHYSGEYLAAYPSAADEELYFDTTTGDLLTNADLPIQTLFTLNGYFDFLNKYWLPGVKPEFQKAKECADIDPSCTYYDIAEYTIEYNKLVVRLTNDCYPHVAAACNPAFEVKVPFDSLKKYLSPQGARVLIQDRYPALTGIGKYLYNNSVWSTMPLNIYMFGLIDGKYPISIAFNYDGAGSVQGYYYYDKRKQKLQLAGTWTGEGLKMTETVNGQVTGQFHLVIYNGYVENAFSYMAPNGELNYLTGTWSTPDGTKKMTIKFTEMKSTTKGERQ